MQQYAIIKSLSNKHYLMTMAMVVLSTVGMAMLITHSNTGNALAVICFFTFLVLLLLRAGVKRKFTNLYKEYLYSIVNNHVMEAKAKNGGFEVIPKCNGRKYVVNIYESKDVYSAMGLESDLEFALRNLNMNISIELCHIGSC